MRNRILPILILCIGIFIVGFIGCKADEAATLDKKIGGTPLTGNPTTQQAYLHLTVDAANGLKPYAQDLPAPYSTAAEIVLSVIAAGATYFGATKTTQVSNLKTVIANAAPGVLKLITQATDGQSLPTDISTASQIPSGVTTLVNHPVATSALTAASAGAVISKV